MYSSFGHESNRIDSSNHTYTWQHKFNCLPHRQMAKCADQPTLHTNGIEANQICAEIDCLRHSIKLLMLSNYNCVQFIICNIIGPSNKMRWIRSTFVRMGGGHRTSWNWVVTIARKRKSLNALHSWNCWFVEIDCCHAIATKWQCFIQHKLLSDKWNGNRPWRRRKKKAKKKYWLCWTKVIAKRVEEWNDRIKMGIHTNNGSKRNRRRRWWWNGRNGGRKFSTRTHTAKALYTNDWITCI